MRPRPLPIDRLSDSDRRVLRRLARSMRGWVVPPGSSGRQGELAGTVAVRIEAARDAIRQRATHDMAEARRSLGRLSVVDEVVKSREGVRDRARTRLDALEAQVAADPTLLDPGTAEPPGPAEGSSDGPPIPWSRLLLVLGFVVLEYFLSLRVPSLLGLEGFQVEIVAAAFAMALVVLPKMVGSSLRDGAATEEEKRRARKWAMRAAAAGTAGAVLSSAWIREVVFDPEAPPPPDWCLPVLAMSVSLASFATSALAPEDARERAADAREHLRNEVRRILGVLTDYLAQRRPIDAAKRRADRFRKDLDGAAEAAKQAEGAVEAAHAERAQILGQLGSVREQLGADLAEAEWAERSAVADQRALLQVLANMTLLEANRRPWPWSWITTERRAWEDGVVDAELLPAVPSDFDEPLGVQAASLLQIIDTQLASAYPDETAGAA